MGNFVLPLYVENSLCELCTDLTVYCPNIMQNCSRTFFYEIHVLLEKYAQLLVLQNEFELREGI
jgi:hypothetical protein